MKFTYREYMFNILNGISMGVIVALIPSALLGQLMQALSGTWPGFSSSILTITTFNMSLLPAMAAFSVGYLCRMNMVQMSSLAGAAMVGSGVMHQTAQGFLLAGTGDVINTGITITFAVWLARLVGERFKNYTVLLLPIIVIVGAGAFGLFTLPYVQAFTGLIGAGIKTFIELQPLLMGILMGITFAVLICSPISSVGIATAIGITGIASGSANLGITAGAFTLAIMGSSVNSLGTVFAHFLGTPKLQMGNMLEKPKLFLPVIISAGIMGGLGALCNIQGTKMSAGFGFSGLVGPLAAYQAMPAGLVSLGLITLLFVILPLILGYSLRYLFITRFKLFSANDLLIETK